MLAVSRHTLYSKLRVHVLVDLHFNAIKIKMWHFTDKKKTEGGGGGGGGTLRHDPLLM